MIAAIAIGAVLVAAVVVSFSSFRNSKIVDISRRPDFVGYK